MDAGMDITTTRFKAIRGSLTKGSLSILNCTKLTMKNVSLVGNHYTSYKQKTRHIKIALKDTLVSIKR